MQTSFTLAQLADPDVAEADKILRACVHCGFCTATCPTYVLLGDELDSPRGRIYLIKEMLEHDAPATEEVVRHMLETGGAFWEGGRWQLDRASVESLEVPPGGKLVLEPGGNHLMVMGLKKHPAEGEKVNLTITLEPGGHEIRLEIPVSRKPVS